MTVIALADSFSGIVEFPIRVDMVLDWIRVNTDHKVIKLYDVKREKRAFRGGFRRVAVPVGNAYSGDFEIVSQIFYGGDLAEDWKRLVIVKEALHVFDADPNCVSTPEQLRKLIPQIIARQLNAQDIIGPALNDRMGAIRAMAVLIPEPARTRLAQALENSSRNVEEIAQYVQLPEVWVDFWLHYGDEILRVWDPSGRQR